jgi:ATP-dependent Clp protease adapter protein ClpS
LSDSVQQELAGDARPGTIEAFRIAGVPVFLHWSLPLGGLLIASCVHADWRVALYCCIAYTLLIAAHELGHAAAAVSLRLKVHAIHLSGFGGRCRFQTPRTLGGAFFVCSAGLLAQLILFAGAASYIALFGWPRSVLALCVVNTFTLANLLLFAINVIPQRLPKGLATDGSILWRLLMHARRGYPNPWPTLAATSPVFPSDTSLLARSDMKPVGFKTGIEILNDDKTPMAFVVQTLMKNLEIDQQQAVAMMLNIHNNGGLLVPTRDIEEATRVAKGIADDCKTHNQLLVCRAVKDGA